MLKRFGLIMIVIVVLISFSACGSKRAVETLSLEDENVIVNDENKDLTVNDENENLSFNEEIKNVSVDDEDININEKVVKDEIELEPEAKEVEITLYYSNNEHIITGDESLDKILPVKKSVLVGEKSIEEIVVSELQIEPEDEGLTTNLADLNILSVETVENTVHVNVSGEDLSGGSLMEIMVLQPLVYSLTELDKVEAVQILVDGNKEVSLMGHMYIQDPLTREDFQ